ncbi:MAG: di-trans,poly-cis-decaprenylcistransferase, partial [Proteobacteria bacterium]|nr:di-trans,poly-cis-decaprenylcistransferase [Pseudomonadota bacterium]
RHSTGLVLTVAVGYGGRWDIVEAARNLAEDVKNGVIESTDIDEATFAKGLQIASLPDPDILIRTGGEQRISNFLLWNLAYAELFFTDTLWPDFDVPDFDAALAHFSSKQRRFGQTGAQVETVGC